MRLMNESANPALGPTTRQEVCARRHPTRRNGATMSAVSHLLRMPHGAVSCDSGSSTGAGPGAGRDHRAGTQVPLKTRQWQHQSRRVRLRASHGAVIGGVASGGEEVRREGRMIRRRTSCAMRGVGVSASTNEGSHHSVWQSGGGALGTSYERRRRIVAPTRAVPAETVDAMTTVMTTALDQVAAVGATAAPGGASADAVGGAAASVELTSAITAFRPTLDSTEQGFSIFRGVVSAAQNLMGLTAKGVSVEDLPTGGVVETILEPTKVFSNVINATQTEARLGTAIDDTEWTKVVNSVDVDLALLLVAVVTVVPLCKAIDVSPVLGFLGAGLLLNQEGLFSENQEVEQFCELGIQFLLFEMGLELSVKRLKALGKYAFGLGLNQVLFVNILFAAALLPPGHALGTQVLEAIQNTDIDILQINSSLQAVVIGFALSLSSSALGLQLLADKKLMTTRLGTASLGVLLFQDLAVVPFIILLPVLQSLGLDGGGGGAVEMDYGLMAASAATSFLDLGVLSYAGYWAAVQGYKLITKLECGNDVFVALSLLVLFGFSNATSAIGFSDSLGAFLAGLVLAGTPYAHDIIAELRAFKGLFMSLFFVTIGTTIDLPLAIELFPIVIAMTLGLMVAKTGVVTAMGPITGLTWQESLVAGAFLSQGGEFAFVIFGQATSGSGGSLFQQDLDQLLVVVVIASMALTPLVVDLATKVAGPMVDLESGCEEGDDDGLLGSGSFDVDKEACEVAFEISESLDQAMKKDPSSVVDVAIDVELREPR